LIYKLKEGRTPLHLAANTNHLAIVHYLGEQVANIKSREQDNSIPLHWAVQNGHTTLVEALIIYGTDVKAQNAYGKTPIQVVSFENLDAANKIIEMHKKGEYKTTLTITSYN